MAARQSFILTMKLDHLLRHRSALLRQTRLANLAFAFAELSRFAERIARGNLRGEVTLEAADHATGRDWPTLVAEDGSQAVIEEHFLDQDILDLADLLAFTSGNPAHDTFTFRLEEFDRRFRDPVREELAAAGVELPGEPAD